MAALAVQYVDRGWVLSMKGLMISGNKGRYTAGSPDNPWKNSTGAEAWYELMGWDYWGNSIPSSEFCSHYDLVFANTEIRMIAGLTRLAESRRKGQIWISLIEGPGEAYTSEPMRFKRLFDASDAVISINKRTVEYLQSLTSSPVLNIGVPYPIEWVSQFASPFESRGNEALIAPWLHAGPSMVVASNSGAVPVVYTKKTARTIRNHFRFRKTGEALRNAQRDLKRAELDLPGNIDFRFERELPEFFADAGKMRFWVNLDPRHTWARFVLDAAALSMPMISTACTDHAAHLYPDTTVESIFEVARATDIARRLVEDSDFARHVGETAHERMLSYSGLRQEQRMNDLIAELVRQKKSLT